ncbi:19141_t:CDS:1, partial [Gigaspora margarita]
SERPSAREIQEILNIWITNNYFDKIFKEADINKLETRSKSLTKICTNTMSVYQLVNHSNSSKLKNLIDIPKVNLDKFSSIALQKSDCILFDSNFIEMNCI